MERTPTPWLVDFDEAEEHAKAYKLVNSSGHTIKEQL